MPANKKIPFPLEENLILCKINDFTHLAFLFTIGILFLKRIYEMKPMLSIPYYLLKNNTHTSQKCVYLKWISTLKLLSAMRTLHIAFQYNVTAMREPKLWIQSIRSAYIVSGCSYIYVI